MVGWVQKTTFLDINFERAGKLVTRATLNTRKKNFGKSSKMADQLGGSNLADPIIGLRFQNDFPGFLQKKS